MNPLYPSPLGERTAAALQAGLTLLDLIFPGRIKACYLTGSTIDGTAVTIGGDALNSSDIDMVIVLRGTLTTLDCDRFAQWRAMCERLGPFHLDQLDATVTSKTDLAQHGHLTLKTASHLLYGEDLRAAITSPSLQTHLHRAIKWQYRLPENPSAQAELRALCHQVLAFEAYCLTTYSQK